MRLSRLRGRFWVETGLAIASAALTVLTIVSHDWLEFFGIEPDEGNGSVEALITVGVAAIALAFVVAARVEWVRTRERRADL